jgi:ABC-type antimicrobial peptide transport system permease subunit
MTRLLIELTAYSLLGAITGLVIGLVLAWSITR